MRRVNRRSKVVAFSADASIRPFWHAVVIGYANNVLMLSDRITGRLQAVAKPGAIGMRVRKAGQSDVEAMARVTVDTFLAAHRSQIPDEVWNSLRQNWTPEVSRRGWERTLRDITDGASPQDCVYVAVSDAGAIVGVAMGAPADGDGAPTAGKVCVLYVHPDHQRQGAGHRLVEAVAAHLAQQGMTTLEIEVLKANAPARRFYEALGGRIVADRHVEDACFRLPSVVYGWSDIRTVVADDGSEQ